MGCHCQPSHGGRGGSGFLEGEGVRKIASTGLCSYLKSLKPCACEARQKMAPIIRSNGVRDSYKENTPTQG